MRIEELNAERMGDMNRANEEFAVIGRIVPALQNGVWTYTEELFERPWVKTYPADETDWHGYIGSEEKTAFLAYEKDECIGQIVLRADWNRYALIEDIGVARAMRGRGVGRALIGKAQEWAQRRGLCGLALETQDNNLSACRFYAACGFEIGGVNTMFYRNFDRPYCGETAIFWYKRFGKGEDI